MSTTIEAIYEAGTLRLAHPIDLADGSRVNVIVIPREIAESAQTPDQPTPCRRTPAEVAAEIAALPMESRLDGFSGEDHDEILYGWEKPR